MYLVVKQLDGLKLQYSSHRAEAFSTVLGLQEKQASCRVSTQGKREQSFSTYQPTTDLPRAAGDLPSAAEHRNCSTSSGTHPVFIYLAVRKGIKDKQIPQNLTKGRCMAGKEKHCSFNPKPVSQSTIISSRHHADTPSRNEQAV